MSASEQNRRSAYDFLERMTPCGSADPQPALKAAFDSKPDLVYWLSDGFCAHAHLTAFVGRLNRERKVVVNTIAFIEDDEGYKDALKKIAQENGGQYKFVTGPFVHED